MAGRFVIHPLNRGVRPIKIVIQNDGGKVSGVEAGTTFYWDFAKSLRGKSPLDAIHFTQRLSGDDFVSHALASTRALEEIVQVKIPLSARIIRNIMLGLQIIYCHITHFYQSVLPDYIMYPGAENLSDISADFRMGKEVTKTIMGHVWYSFEIRRSIQQIFAIISGKAPHVTSIITGGLTRNLTGTDILTIQSIHKQITDFINNEYTYDIYHMKKAYSDTFNIGRNNGRLLAVGEFPQKDKDDYMWPASVIKDAQLEKFDSTKITIECTGSWYEPELGGNYDNPLDLRLKTLPDKPGGYTWIKGALYDKETYEVGALARMMAAENKNITDLGVSAYSVMGRYRARLEECYILSGKIKEWVGMINPKEKAVVKVSLPDKGKAVGVAESAGGPIIHFVSLDGGKIVNYNVLDALSWNLCPTTTQGQRGPLEQALLELPVPNAGIPVVINRVARSF